MKIGMIKSKKEIEIIREGGVILNKILRKTAALVKPGVSTSELDKFAEKEIIAAGGRPSFKNYGEDGNFFPASLCTSVNDVVVHGIPSKKAILKEGDIIGLDIGMQYKGLFTDTAITVVVGEVSKDIQKLLDVTQQALAAGIKAAKFGNRIGDISAAVEKVAELGDYGVVRDLVGHGVGYDVHEAPQVPNYGKAGTGMELVEGMVLAIEPMFNLGGYKVVFEDDGWTISTFDGKPSAHFEHTVVVTKKGGDILT